MPHLVENCQSLHKCRTCNLPHNTVLHFDRNSKMSAKENPMQTFPLSAGADVFLPKIKEIVTHTITCIRQFNYHKSEEKLRLCTDVNKVNYSISKTIPCIILLDFGSAASFTNEECAKKLKLCRQKTKLEVSCLSSYNIVTSGQVELNFTPHFKSNSKFRTYALVKDNCRCA